jgi:uncharacterized protein YegL
MELNVCPITHTPVNELKEPVITPDGITYEREAIEKWLIKNSTCPVTGKQLKIDQLIKNRALIVEKTKTNKFIGKKINFILSAALDVSGSMATEASIINKNGIQESHGLNQLDLAKHALVTIIHAMTETQMFGLTVFSSSAKVVFPMSIMNKHGKKRALKIIDDIKTEGCTNIWDGIYKASRLVDIDIDNKFPKRCVWLLTDGHPTYDTPKSYKEMINDYNAEYGDNRSIRTFGFGESIDSELLMNIANYGQSSFSYIPDTGFVGTVIVNALANSIEFKILDESEQEKKRREKFIHCLDCILETCKIFKSKFGSTSVSQYNLDNAKIIYKNYLDSINNSYQEDEIHVALSDKNYWNKWAPHYMRSLIMAHKNKECNNFKDKSVQIYKNYRSCEWNSFRDYVHTLFKELPAPKPSTRYIKRVSQGKRKRLTTLASYSQVSNGCFHEKAHIILLNGSKIKCKDVFPGLIVQTYNTETSMYGKDIIECIVRIKCKSDLSKFIILNNPMGQKLYITPWHPIFYENKWIFPGELSKATEIYSEYMYSFVLKNRSHAMIVDGYPCITLAAGIQNDKVAQHDFWGTEKIVNDLKKMDEWKKGIIELTQDCIIRTKNTGKVIGIKNNNKK